MTLLRVEVERRREEEAGSRLEQGSGASLRSASRQQRTAQHSVYTRNGVWGDEDRRGQIRVSTFHDSGLRGEKGRDPHSIGRWYS